MPKVQESRAERALVTGGGRGIGAETALLLAQQGYDVDITVLSKVRRAMPVVNAIRRMNRKVTLIEADLSTPEGVDYVAGRVGRKGRTPLTRVSLNVAGGLEEGSDRQQARRLNVQGQSRLVEGLIFKGMADGGRFGVVGSHWSEYGSKTVLMPPFPGKDYSVVADTKLEGREEIRTMQGEMDERGITVGNVVIGLVTDTTIGSMGMKRLPHAYVARQADMNNLVTAEEAGKGALASLTSDEYTLDNPYVVGADLSVFLESESLDRVWLHNDAFPPVEEILTHEEPRVRLDGVLECVAGESTTGFYRVKEDNVKGHFGIMPGVEIAEAAAQAGAYVIMMERPGEVGVLLDSINNFVFTDMVLAGETITSEVKITGRDGDQFTGEAIVKVEGREVARGAISGRVTKSKPGDVERGAKIIKRRRDRDRAEAVAAGIDPHLALAPREIQETPPAE